MSRPSGEHDGILFLSPERPYPLAGGGALRSACLLHAVADRGPVDLITFSVDGDRDPALDLPPGLVASATTVSLPRHSKAWPVRAVRNGSRMLRGRTPLMDRFGRPESAARIAEALHGKRYALAVIEHFWCAPYVDLIARHADQVVLDLHNIESVLHASCAANEQALERFGHRVFSRRARLAEKELLPRFDLVLAASEKDAARVRELAPTTRVAVFPNAIPLQPRPSVAERSETIVFSGNLEYHPNVSAIRFFRESVWPSLRTKRPGLTWRLVGRNETAMRRKMAQEPGIEFSGPISDAVAELARASLVVAPLLAGSGTRVKIMEAWAAARAVVSTPIGAEGLPARNGENLVIVDSPDQWTEQVIELLDNSAKRGAIGDSGRLTYDRLCCWPAAWRTLDDTLAPLSESRQAARLRS